MDRMVSISRSRTTDMITANQIRIAIFTAVPEYKPLHRINVKYVSDKGAMISLCIGLLSKEAVAAFDKVGALDETRDRITAELTKLYGRPVVASDVSRSYGVNRYSHGFTFTVVP